MRIRPLEKKLFRDLLRLKGQLFAVCLVIACGIATYIAMLSTHDSLEEAMDSYYSRDRFAHLFASLKRAPERLRGRLEAVPGVRVVETRVVAQVTLDVPGTREAVSGRLVSLPDFGRPRLNDVHLRRGRLPEPRRDDEALVSEAFAEAHGLLPGDTLVTILNERKKVLRITGIALSPEFVYAIRPGGVLPDNRLFGILWMRRRPLASAFDMDGAFNDVVASIDHDALAERVAAEFDLVLDPFGCLGTTLRANQESNWYLQSEFEQIRATGMVMPFVFLGVAAFLLNVILSRLVEQQREQIALLKAFGYSNGRIGLHYLQLVLLVVLLAAALGCAGGAWMGKGTIAVYREYYRFPALDYLFRAPYLVQGGLVALLAALLGTLRALRAAVRLPPAEAMRPMPPARFQVTRFERLLARRWLGTISRMVLRNIGRRPWKALFSTVGIACSVALLVVGNGMMDSVRYIMDVQFSAAQREDLRVTFVQPRDSRAISDLARYPGVRYTEPLRTVAARLSHEHRFRRLGLIGIQDGARLTRPLDDETRPVPVPSEGLLVSSKLAEILAIEVGDVVRIDLLEGDRGSHALPVSRIFESFIGLGAYMEIDALNRMLQEGPVISGADLLVDSARLDPLHRRIKETPAIAAATSRKEAYRSFEETAAESLRISTLFMTFFAVVMACGVVYNNARLILAERTRELASMRVLGYRRGEISAILVGELLLLTALAIPLGFLFGAGLLHLSCQGLDSELYRIPTVILPRTLGIAFVTVAGAALISSLLVRRRLDRLDLVEVLKTRE